MIAAYTDWAKMTPEGWIQAVGTLLLFLMVWLVKNLIRNHTQMLIDMKDQGAKDRVLLREQADKDRALIKEECNFVRNDHQLDMRALFDDSKENRRTYEVGFKEVAAAIRSLSTEIRKGGA